MDHTFRINRKWLAKVAATVVFFIVLFLLSPAANAGDLVARQGDDTARLTEQPCINPEVVARLAPDAVKSFQAATVRFGGQVFEACWREAGDDVYLVYADGDQGIIPKDDFKPPLEV